MKREDDEQLWDLLGNATPPQVSPFFARNVSREVRPDTRSSRTLSWLSWRTVIPVSGLTAVTLAIAMIYTFSFRQKPVTEDDAIAKIDAQDYEVVADLDELLASDENSLWDDNSSL
jgi:hypothetical protein